MAEEYLGHLLGVTAKALSRKSSSRVREFGLTIQQFGVLNALYSRDRLTSHQLVKQLKADSSSIMSLVDQLEKKGLITREPGIQDRRMKHLVLTVKALAMKKALVTRVNELDRELTAQISVGEKEQLTKALLKIREFALDSDSTQPHKED
jgi:DNA-binding MarR family transcriptional regulator